MAHVSPDPDRVVQEDGGNGEAGPSTLATFCDKCKAIQLDDSKWGGHAARDHNGHEILMLSPIHDPEGARKTDYEVDDDYPSLPYLSQSAAEGCDCCRWLRESALAHKFDVTRLTVTSPGESNKRPEKRTLRISVSYHWKTSHRGPSNNGEGLWAVFVHFWLSPFDGCYHTKVAYHVETDPDDLCAEWLGLSTRGLNIMSTPDTVSWIDEMLGSCQCFPRHRTTRFIPNRLLRVDCDPPRLVETSKTPDEERLLEYTAISYCWGSPEQAGLQMTTDTASLPARLAGIKESEMTPVLRDPIQVTRMLSIPYLWIDALCIIQDDRFDWERESIWMGQIYSSAYLTICGLSSTSCLEGFLDRQPALLTMPFQSRLNPRIHGSYRLRAVPCDLSMASGFKYSENSEFNMDLTSSVWHQRGWTLQESAMSTRILAFGNFGGVHFRCPKEPKSYGSISLDEPYIFQLSLLDEEPDDEQCYERWYLDVVIPYSKMLLTYKKDRFPAISGLAAYFNKRLNDDYIAGLWGRDIHRGLVWAENSLIMTHRTPSLELLLCRLRDAAQYDAPSWSWASRQSPVDYAPLGYFESGKETRMHRQEFQLLDSRVLLQGTNPYGQTTRATLHIKGRTHPLPDVLSVSRYGISCIEVDDQSRAFCRLDWANWNSYTALETHPRQGLRMLLLGSAYFAWLSGPTTPSSVPSSPSDGVARSEPIDMPKNATYQLSPPTTRDPDDPGFDARLSCADADARAGSGRSTSADLPAAPELDEDNVRLYGIVLHPASRPGEYFRVGIFYSQTFHQSRGLMRLFDGCDESTITLV